MSWGVNEWVAVVSALLAVLSLGLNWLVVRRQIELQFETLKVEMDAEVFAWSHQAVDAVTEGVALARSAQLYPTEEFQRAAIEVEHKLSAIADRGRLLFPNDNPHLTGKEKEGAFQGVRPPILDAVVFACCQMNQIARQAPDKSHESAAEFLVKCRRLLVSEAQNAIDPRRRGAMLKRLDVGRRDDTRSNFDVAYELGSAFDARYPDLPVMKVWLEAQERIRNGARA
jgi:hypothetical protein